MVTIAAMAAALAFSLLQPARYASTAQILVPVTPRYSTALVDQNGAVRNQDAKRLLQNQVEFIESAVISDAAAKTLGSRPKITARALPDADILEVRAESSDPNDAAKIANTVADTYVQNRSEDSIQGLNASQDVVEKSIASLNEKISAIDRRLDEMTEAQKTGQEGADLRQVRTSYVAQRQAFLDKLNSIQVSTGLVPTDAAKVINPALPTDSPFQPTTRRNLLIGMVAGLVLGLGLMYALDQLDVTVKTKSELEAVTKLTNLASIPRSPSWRRGEVAVLHSQSDPTSPTAEGYRALRTAIQFASLAKPIRTLLITSALPNEGKSSTAANLAVAFAASGQRVAVVSCDLRRPRLHDFFEMDDEIGFTSILRRMIDVDEMLGDPQPREVVVIPSGQAPRNPSELLATAQAQKVLDDIAERVDLLIIDAPPVLPVSDAVILSAYADAALLVARAGETRIDTVERAAEQLRLAAAPVIGTVLIGADDDPGVGYSYRRYAHRTTRSDRRRDAAMVSGRGTDADGTSAPTPAAT